MTIALELNHALRTFYGEFMGSLGAQLRHRLILISLMTFAAVSAHAEVSTCLRLMENIGIDKMVYRLPKFVVEKTETNGHEFTYHFTNGLWAKGYADDPDHSYDHSAKAKKYGIDFDYNYMVRFTDSPMSAFELTLRHRQNALVSRFNGAFYYEESKILFSYLEGANSNITTIMKFDLHVKDSKGVASSTVTLHFDRARYLRRVVVTGSKDPRVLSHYHLADSRIFNSAATYDLNEDSPLAKRVVNAILKRDLNYYRLRSDVFDQVAKVYGTGEPLEFSALFENALP